MNLHGQNAYDSKQTIYDYGAYIPTGSTGSYFETLHFKYKHTGVSVSSENQQEYDKVLIVVRAFPGEVNKYKYNGKTYVIQEICGTHIGVGFLNKFTMSITITGAGSHIYI